ncbi:MAG: tRNA (guanosine(37)-N1)-methyltransferase TrmD [Acidimicrobiia bacterium]|nr:tRNA (guanosine(37)-N1)-methyltransferase TrmD [Acidimicrobiia bacterium]
MIRFDVFTLFPDLVRTHAGTSLLGRAVDEGIVTVEVHDMRDHGLGRHRQVDDTVFGGGPGMVLRPDVVAASIDAAALPPGRRLVLSASGRRLDQALLQELSAEPAVALVCGRYEGVDQRVIDAYELEAVSIGDYVVAGGEVAAMVVVEGVARLVPGVMGSAASAHDESFADGLLEAPTYTRPQDWRGRSVPAVLTSGDHGAVAAWRRREALRLTARVRPGLIRAALASGRLDRAELEAAEVAAATLDRLHFEESS